jgi:hypothetical protein
MEQKTQKQALHRTKLFSKNHSMAKTLDLPRPQQNLILLLQSQRAYRRAVQNCPTIQQRLRQKKPISILRKTLATYIKFKILAGKWRAQIVTSDF